MDQPIKRKRGRPKGSKNRPKLKTHQVRKINISEEERERRRKNWKENLSKYAWKPGNSGNPAGRPPGLGSIRIALKQRMSEPMLCTYKGCMGTGYIKSVQIGKNKGEVQNPCPECKGSGFDKHHRTWAEFIADSVAMQAAGGSMRAAETILEQLDGRPPEQAAQEGETGIIDVRVLQILMTRADERKKLKKGGQNDEKEEPEEKN